MNAPITLPPNGFGRFEQQIVFSIREGQREGLTYDLDIVPIFDHSSSPRVSYLWRRWSARWGDDEDIVVELSAILGTPEDSGNWQIDWKASAY